MGFNVPLQTPDPMLALPAGTVLSPTVLVRNTTPRAATATLSISWHGEKETVDGEAKLQDLHLAPYETRQAQIAPLGKQIGMPDTARWATLKLASAGSPDDLTAVASSYDPSGRYGTEVAFSDNIGSHFAGGRWQADSTHDAIIAVTNAGAVVTEARLTLHYQKGEKQYEVQRRLKPGQQMWIRLAELIRNQIPDHNGNALPIGLSNGTFEVQDTQHFSGSLLVSAISFDNTWGSRVQPQVPECCGINVPTFYPSFFDIPPNDLWNVFETVANDACTGDQENIGEDMINFWTTNSSIAQMTASGVKGLVVGSTTGEGESDPIWVGAGSNCILKQVTPTAPITVQLPTSLSVLNVAVLPNGQGLNFGCSGLANCGILVDIKYQVLDQSGSPIRSANMTPHEHGTFFSGGTYDRNIGPTGFTNSTATTAADGTFHDVPFGVCANGVFSSATATQFITMIMPDGSAPTVRGQTFTATGKTAGHGTLVNSVSDISATR